MRRSADADREDPDVVVPPEDLIIVAAGYGRWQFMITVLICLSIAIHAMNTSMEPIEHMNGWWCEKPAVLRSWTNREWIMFSHVNATRRDFSAEVTTERFRGCYVYKYNFSRLVDTPYDQRPRMDDSGNIVICEKVHYSRKFGKTIAEKFDLGCDPDFDRSIWHAFIMVGRVLGYVVFGCLSDRFGRKPILFLGIVLTPLTSLAIAFAPNYKFFLISQTLHSFFHGCFIASFIIALEITENGSRTRVAAICALAQGLGVGLTPVLFRALGSLDALTLTVNLPIGILLIGIVLIPESPSWLFCTRNSKVLTEVTRRAAKTNGIPLQENFRVIYIEQTDAEKILPREKPAFWEVLREPETACDVTGVGYLVTLSALIEGSAQGKLIYNEKRIHRWYLIVGLVSMSGIMISQFSVLLMGHKKLLHVAVFLILLSTATTMVNLHEDYLTTTGPATTLLAANLFAVSLSHGALINYTGRTVPTLLRGTYLGFWNGLRASFSWAGTHRYLNYPGISSVAVITILLAALATLNICDLKGRELPDTVSDAANFKDKPKPKRWSMSETQGHY